MTILREHQRLTDMKKLLLTLRKFFLVVYSSFFSGLYFHFFLAPAIKAPIAIWNSETIVFVGSMWLLAAALLAMIAAMPFIMLKELRRPGSTGIEGFWGLY